MRHPRTHRFISEALFALYLTQRLSVNSRSNFPQSKLEVRICREAECNSQFILYSGGRGSRERKKMTARIHSRSLGPMRASLWVATDRAAASFDNRHSGYFPSLTLTVSSALAVKALSRT